MSDVCWSNVAPAWEAHADDIEATSGAATDALLAAAAIAPGEDVLELAAGTGHLAVQLAELVGPEGSVIATDSSDVMVDLIDKRLAPVPNASAGTADLADLPDDLGSFDLVLSRMGLMFVPEPALALEGVRRVLRPGGRLAVAVWGDMASNPWMVAVGFATTMAGLMAGPPPNQPGGPFSLGDPDQLEGVAVAAGFTDVDVQVVDYSRHYSSVAAQFDVVRVLAPPVAAALETATDDQLAAVRKGAEDFVARYRTDDGSLDLPARALVLTARAS